MIWLFDCSSSVRCYELAQYSVRDSRPPCILSIRLIPRVRTPDPPYYPLALFQGSHHVFDLLLSPPEGWPPGRTRRSSPCATYFCLHWGAPPYSQCSTFSRLWCFEHVALPCALVSGSPWLVVLETKIEPPSLQLEIHATALLSIVKTKYSLLY